MHVKYVLDRFVCSRFYRWSRTVFWLVAVLIIANSNFYRAVTTLGITLGYTFIPVLLMRITDSVSHLSREHPTQARIEEYKNTSPVIAYLSTLLDDISHINAISGDFGVEFDFAKVTLSEFPLLDLHLSSDEDRIDFIQRYHDDAVSWWRGEGKKNPEELQREFFNYFRYDGDGYTAKNASFRKELEEESLSELKYDPSGWYIGLRGLLAVNAGRYCAGKIAVTAITECVEAHGYYISHRYDNGDVCVLWITFC